jgi:CRISPR system Cascade subunit CasA
VRRTTPTIWELLWANVPPGGEALRPDELPRVFPWMSDGFSELLTPADMHPSHVWWGQPRRIRLVRRDAAVRCDLTGVEDTVSVTGWQQKASTAYVGWGHAHPLTHPIGFSYAKVGMHKLNTL